MDSEDGEASDRPTWHGEELPLVGNFPMSFGAANNLLPVDTCNFEDILANLSASSGVPTGHGDNIVVIQPRSASVRTVKEHTPVLEKRRVGSTESTQRDNIVIIQPRNASVRTVIPVLEKRKVDSTESTQRDNIVIIQPRSASVGTVKEHAPVLEKRKVDSTESTQSAKILRLDISNVIQIAQNPGTSKEPAANESGGRNKGSNITVPAANCESEKPCVKLPCPFKRIGSVASLSKGVMINHQNLKTMNIKHLSICPLCIQKCGETKSSPYDMLMHVALHKGVKNLHCLCSECGRYAGRYMEKIGSSTNIITSETFEQLWSPKDSRWQDICTCSSSGRTIVFDCVLDMKCFMNLVLLKMQKQPNSKIEVFVGLKPFKEHLESHAQVSLASSLCELCREDPRYCNFRLHKGQYVTLQKDKCDNTTFHQGSCTIVEGSMYCRMFCGVPEDETGKHGLDKEIFPRHSGKRKADASNDQEIPLSPDAVPNREVAVEIPVAADPQKETMIPTTVGKILKQSSAATSKKYVSILPQSVRHTAAAAKRAPSFSLSSLDGFVIPFKQYPLVTAMYSLTEEQQILHSVPKLRCPAYRNGCKFASWHLKLMDTHIKAHLHRVNLSIMFTCIPPCCLFFHNLFDFFIHLQEKHGSFLKQEEHLSSFQCRMGSFEEEEEGNQDQEEAKKTLENLLFASEEKEEDAVVCQFSSYMWISKLLVSSGYIRKMAVDATRISWLDSPTDFESWMREEIHAMQLYEGRVFYMRFEDVRFVDAYTTISVDGWENDNDFMWAQLPGYEDSTSQLKKSDYIKQAVPLSEYYKAEKTQSDPSKSESDRASYNQVLTPLFLTKERGQIFGASEYRLGRRYDIKTIHNKLGRKKFTPCILFTQTEQERFASRVVAGTEGLGMLNVSRKMWSEAQDENYSLDTLTSFTLPPDYTLPPNLNSCQFVDMCVVSIVANRGKMQVRVVLKEIEDITYHQCPYCPKAETDIFNISRHLNKHHKIQQNMDEQDVVPKKCLLMLCRHCDFVSFSTLACWLHLQNEHNAKLWPNLDAPAYSFSTIIMLRDQVISKFVCVECGVDMGTRNDVIEHMMDNHKSFQCPSIQLGSISVQAVTEQDKQVVHLCVFCDYVDVRKEGMEWHVSRAHSYTRLLSVCMYCEDYNTIYFTKSLISAHYNEHHPKVMPLWCSFTLVGDLDKSTFNKVPRGRHRKHNTKGKAKGKKSEGPQTDAVPKAHAGVLLPPDSMLRETITSNGDDRILHTVQGYPMVVGPEGIKGETMDSKDFVGMDFNEAGYLEMSGSPNQDPAANASDFCVKLEPTDDSGTPCSESTIMVEIIKMKEEQSDGLHPTSVLGEDELKPEMKTESDANQGPSIDVLDIKPDISLPLYPNISVGGSLIKIKDVTPVDSNEHSLTGEVEASLAEPDYSSGYMKGDNLIGIGESNLLEPQERNATGDVRVIANSQTEDQYLMAGLQEVSLIGVNNECEMQDDLVNYELQEDSSIEILEDSNCSIGVTTGANSIESDEECYIVSEDDSSTSEVNPGSSTDVRDDSLLDHTYKRTDKFVTWSGNRLTKEHSSIYDDEAERLSSALGQEMMTVMANGQHYFMSREQFDEVFGNKS